MVMNDKNTQEAVFEFSNEAETVLFATQLQQALADNKAGAVIFLEGKLGVGKTALVRAVLREFGYEGTVKSPTYTLVEEYAAFKVNHFDLYRLSDPEELEFIGVERYFEGDNLNIIEWPEQGSGFLPEPDIRIALTIPDPYQPTRRALKIKSCTPYGYEVVSTLQD